MFSAFVNGETWFLIEQREPKIQTYKILYPFDSLFQVCAVLHAKLKGQ